MYLGRKLKDYVSSLAYYKLSDFLIWNYTLIFGMNFLYCGILPFPNNIYKIIIIILNVKIMQCLVFEQVYSSFITNIAILTLNTLQYFKLIRIRYSRKT